MDTENTTTENPTTPTVREQWADMSRGQRIGVIVVTALILLMVGSCMGGEGDEPETAAGATTSAKADPTPAAEPAKPQTPRQAVEAAIEASGVDGARVEPETSGRRYFVAFDVADNLTTNMIRTGADADALTLLEAVHEADPDAKTLGVRGTFPLTDSYGNTDDGQVYWAHFGADVFKNVNWADVSTLDVEAIAGHYVLHPDFRD